MDWEKEIIRIFEKYDNKLNLQQIFSYIETDNNIKLSQGKKLLIRQKLSNLSNKIQFSIIEGNSMYELIPQKNYNEKIESIDDLYKKSIKNEYVYPDTSEIKLFKRIKREFQKCTYIGDISLSDEEYSIIIEYLKKYINSIDTKPYNVSNIFLATSLVYIGIKYYDRAYWKHLEEETGIYRIDRQTQQKIGRIFFNTLVKFDKRHVEENEIVNNILMHCFVTAKYAEEFFDFLFAYYNFDLDRDLTQNTPEMMSHLVEAMKKSDNHSLRTYKIKKHTADAVMMNEKGCKIRIGNVLKYIDTYIFEDKLPDKSQNRIAKLFVEWAKNSKRFALEKSNYASVKVRDKKRFHLPYFNLDLKTKHFRIVLPVQTIRTDFDENTPIISWQIIGQSFSEKFNVDCEETVLGYKTESIKYFDIASECLFETINIKLLYNGIVKKSFTIKSDSVRFFDLDDGNWIKYDVYIRAGSVFAVTLNSDNLQSEKVVTIESIAGLKAYELMLETGDIIKLPSGQPLSVGKPLEEGIVSDSLVKNVFVKRDGCDYPVYSKAPSLHFNLSDHDVRGTVIIINNEKSRFDKALASQFNSSDGKSNYLLDLKTYCLEDGIYSVSVNIPSERRIRKYEFALVNGLNIIFDNALYIYSEKGKMKISTDKVHDVIDFDIKPEDDNLLYTISKIDLFISIPAFKWKYAENDLWEIKEPEIVWYKEFPKIIYFKFPDTSIRVFGDTINIDVEKNEIILNKNKDTNIFICDTTKIPSWWYGTTNYSIKIGYDNSYFDFLTIITKNILNKAAISNNPINSSIIVKSDISGFNDCAADVWNDNILIAEKVPVKSNGFSVKTTNLSGKFKVVFFEYDSDEDDEFGLDEPVYSEIGTIRDTLHTDFDIANTTLTLKLITRDKKQGEWFEPEKYILADTCIINNFKIVDEVEDGFIGTLKSRNCIINGLTVSVKFKEKSDYTKTFIEYYDDELKSFIPFIYDRTNKSLGLNDYLKSSKRFFVSNGYYYITRKK